MTENDVLNRVEKEIKARQPADFHLQVVRSDVEKNGNWWYITVKPDRSDVLASRYNQIMREVEEVIENEEHESVLLVPALVD